jgi:spermidine synthase
LVWANIIGLILIYLSVGYSLGGKLADRFPDTRVLGHVILGAALYIVVLPFISNPVMAQFAHGAFGLNIVLGSFISVLVLFSIPVIMLGTVTPWALRLALSGIDNAGTVAGRLYALSTLGSIAGTFIPALITIPLIGTQRTVIGTAVLLSMAAFPLVRWRAGAVALLAILLLLAPTFFPTRTAKILFQQDSQYQFVQVAQGTDGRRYLVADAGFGLQSIWSPNTVLTGEYFDGILLAPPLLQRSSPSVLLLGVAGGTIPRAFAKFYPDAKIDGVELDPLVLTAGAAYMGDASNPNLRAIIADGREYLENTSKHYDLIIVDTYHELSMPFYMVTQQFFQLAMAHLNPGGIVLLNIADIAKGQLSSLVAGTLATVAPQTLSWNIKHTSYLIMGFNRPVSAADLETRLAGLPSDLSALGQQFQAHGSPVAPIADPMTDDIAPIDWILAKVQLSF